MLTFRQLDDLPDAVVDIIAATEQEIINDMARRIAKAGAVTETTQWQLSRLEAAPSEPTYTSSRLAVGAAGRRPRQHPLARCAWCSCAPIASRLAD